MRKENNESDNSHYVKFAVTMTISFVVMYAIMFFNVFQLDHVYISLNRVYMALLMVSPMALIMLGMMGGMYKDKKLNMIIAVSVVLVFILSFAGLRTQTAVGDIQYMKGMIPHHSSAIMTSTNANIKDPEVRKLADDIIKAQEKEIAQMKAAISRLQ